MAKPTNTIDAREALVASFCVQEKVVYSQSSLRRLSDRYWNSWTPETTAMLLSSMCMIVTYTVLKHYEIRISAHFTYGMTLNAIISILATASKVSLIFTVSNV